MWHWVHVRIRANGRWGFLFSSVELVEFSVIRPSAAIPSIFFALGWCFQCMICMFFVHYLDNNPWWYEMTSKWMQMGWNHQPVAAFGSSFFVGMMPRVSFSRIQGSTAFNCKSLISYTILHSKIFWLVVSNMFIFHIYWECHNPNWRTHIFQRGCFTTNQYGSN